MKILSLNRRGLESPSKKLALKRLVQLHNPHILLLQETVGQEEVIGTFLINPFMHMKFISEDARGYSRGIALVGTQGQQIFGTLGDLSQVLA